jgi:signal peptidase II
VGGAEGTSQASAARRDEPGTPRCTVRRTISSPRAWAILLIVTILGTATDLWSKSWAFANVARAPVVIDREAVLAARHGLGAMTPPDRMTAIPGVLDFTLVLNPGAVFGIGAGQRMFFAVFTGLAICFALWVFARWTRPRDWSAHAGLGLLLAGGLGNLYDRLVYACVRDFIHPLPRLELPWGLRWPGNGSNEVWPWVSNVADLYLIIGIGLILWHSWRHPPEERPRIHHRGTEAQRDA